MDPIQLIIQQMMAQAIPEWSVSKGEQPVDVGTLAQNMNYQQDIMQTMGNPLVAAMMGYYDPAAFEPTFEQPELPDEPATPRLASWASSADPIQQAILLGVSEGVDPRRVIRDLVEDGTLELAIDPTTDLPDTKEFDYYVGEASALRDEKYERDRWQSQVEQLQPKEIPSPLAEEFRSMGFSLPTETYGAETFVPQLGGLQQRASEKSANANVLQKKANSAATPLGAPSQDVRQRPRQAAPAQADPVAAKQLAKRANKDAFWANTESGFAKREAERSARIALERGRTPFMDQILGRAGI